MSHRAIHVAGTQLLLHLLRNRLALADALVARDYISLSGAAEIAWTGPAHDMAMTDPPRYRALRAAVSLFFLKGYGCMDRQSLATKAAEQIAKTKGP